MTRPALTATPSRSAATRPRRHVRQARPPAAAPTQPGLPVPRWLVGWLGVAFLLMLLNVGFLNVLGDLLLYFGYANSVDDGNVPYRDFAIEYPPLALAPILLPFYLSKPLVLWFNFGPRGAFLAFEAAFAVETWLLAVAGGAIVWRLMDYVLPAAGRGERLRRLAVYVVAYPLLGQLVSRRLDLLPAVMVVLALWLWLRGREGWGWLALAVGVAVKLFPIVVAPLFALDLLARRGWGATLRGGLWFIVACVALFLPAALVSPGGLWNVFSYHAARGMQLESMYANGLLLFNRFTDLQVGVAKAFGAYEAISGWTSRLRVASALLQLAGLAAVYGLYAWRRPFPGAPFRGGRGSGACFATRLYSPPATGESSAEGPLLVLAAALAITVFIAAGKVFSPQYLAWLIPLVVLAPGGAGWRLVRVFLAVLALTQVMYPYGYHELIIRSGIGLALLTARNIVFLVFLGLLAALFVRDTQRCRHALVSEDVEPGPVRP